MHAVTSDACFLRLPKRTSVTRDRPSYWGHSQEKQDHRLGRDHGCKTGALDGGELPPPRPPAQNPTFQARRATGPGGEDKKDKRASMDVGPTPGSECRLCHFLALRPRSHHLTSLRLHLVIYSIGALIISEDGRDWRPVSLTHPWSSSSQNNSPPHTAGVFPFEQP